MARAIGLGYPGGPKIDKLSKEGNPEAIAFPKAKMADSPYDFSFSGLKSAVLNYLNGCKMKNIPVVEADVAASFQKAVVDVLVEHSMRAVKEYDLTNLPLQGEWRPIRRSETLWNRRAGAEESIFTIHRRFSVRTTRR